MTCHVCKRWIAQSIELYQIRLSNLKNYPQVSIHACPNCQGTDWATTPPIESMKNCGNCRFWSQMVAQSIGCGPIEALCLGEGSAKGKMVKENFYCDGWKSDHFGKVDDPPNYGEYNRAAYEEEEGK